MRRIDTNPLLESIRAAYRKSPMYARINESAPQVSPGNGNDRERLGNNGVPEPAAADLPLGIGLDDFERELEERANP